MRHPNRRQVLTSIVFLTRSQAVLPPSCFGEEGESSFSRKKKKTTDRRLLSSLHEWEVRIKSLKSVYQIYLGTPQYESGARNP